MAPLQGRGALAVARPFSSEPARIRPLLGAKATARTCPPSFRCGPSGSRVATSQSLAVPADVPTRTVRALGAEGDRADRIVLDDGRAEGGSRRRVPESNGLVGTSRGGHAARGVEGDGPDPALMGQRGGRSVRGPRRGRAGRPGRSLRSRSSRRRDGRRLSRRGRHGLCGSPGLWPVWMSRRTISPDRVPIRRRRPSGLKARLSTLAARAGGSGWVARWQRPRGGPPIVAARGDDRRVAVEGEREDLVAMTQGLADRPTRIDLEEEGRGVLAADGDAVAAGAEGDGRGPGRVGQGLGRGLAGPDFPDLGRGHGTRCDRGAAVGVEGDRVDPSGVDHGRADGVGGGGRPEPGRPVYAAGQDGPAAGPKGRGRH